MFLSQGGDSIKGATKERWKQLCEHAADEQDPKRLMELVDEINRLLAEKDERLQRPNAAKSSTTSRQ